MACYCYQWGVVSIDIWLGHRRTDLLLFILVVRPLIVTKAISAV